MKIQILIGIFLSLSTSNIFSRPVLVNHNEESNLILISFDGFRWDYLENHTLPSLNKYFVNDGVKITKGLKNAFSTVTFPNHFTLATGLYPESHGNFI
jgi:predicted AlkP superfamily pyrophosphatase or phosphodiesterase